MDILFTAIPFATGGGQIVKAGDTIHDLSKVTVVGETMGRVKAVAQSLNAADNIYDGFTYYNKLRDLGIGGKILAEILGKGDNALWLLNKLRTGYTIVDIGIDAGRSTRSSSYIMESLIMSVWVAKALLKVIIHEILEGSE